MKTVHQFGHEPMFELTFDERAIVISALQTFVASFPQDATAKLMLHTIEQIDLAIRAMNEVERLKAAGWSRADFAAALKDELE